MLTKCSFVLFWWLLGNNGLRPFLCAVRKCVLTGLIALLHIVMANMRGRMPELFRVSFFGVLNIALG